MATELVTNIVRHVLHSCQATSMEDTDISHPGRNLMVDHGWSATAERQLMLKLAELGWLVREVRSHAIPRRDGGFEGATRQAFQGGLRQELADFYRLLAALEGQVERLTAGIEKTCPMPSYLTLRRLIVWLAIPLARLRWLAAVADSVRNLAGGSLIAALESAAAHGEPIVREAMRRCLKLAAAPYLGQVWLWVFQGRLQSTDISPSEFFIVCNTEWSDHLGDGKMWRSGYHLEDKMRSPFISEKIAHHILRAGKSLNFLRECCGETEWTQQAARTALALTASCLQYDQPEALEGVVMQAGADIDSHVMAVLLQKFQLGAHCEALKRYLLLGQGDFIEALMDNVGTELGKAAREISEFSLNGHLDAALRGSSAQYDAADNINRLRVKLETQQPNDEGWDVFTLKYEVEEPIATVLDSTAMKSYLRVFKLLWALKRAEHSLNVSWVDLNSVQRQLETFGRYIKTFGMQAYSMESVWEDMRQCHRLRNEMAHLVTSLQAYIMFEVVEAAWTGFMEALRTTQDLDGLIQAHDSYLQKLLHKTLLADEQNSAKLHGAMPTQQGVQVELRYLLQLTLDLKPRIQSLSEMVRAACVKAKLYHQDPSLVGNHSDWRYDTHSILGVQPEELEHLRSGFNSLDKKYKEQLAKFVSFLPSASQVDLRFLLFRLEASGKMVAP